MKRTNRRTHALRQVGWAMAIAALAVLPCFGQDAAKAAKRERVRRVVLVSLADRRLAVIDDGNVLAYFSVAVGAATSPSPTGEFEIVNRVANPAYYHDGVVMEASESSPVGTRWIGLNLKGYGIHGTNAPRSIGRAASHGCIRLRNRDVEKLYAMLRVGDVVRIRGDRDEDIAEVFGGEAVGTVAVTAEVQPGDEVQELSHGER